MLHVVIRLQSGNCFKETCVGPGGMEHEDAPGVGVHQQAWIAEAVESRTGANQLLWLPRDSVVVAAAQEEIDGIGEVVQVGPAVIGG